MCLWEKQFFSSLMGIAIDSENYSTPNPFSMDLYFKFEIMPSSSTFYQHISRKSIAYTKVAEIRAEQVATTGIYFKFSFLVNISR